MDEGDPLGDKRNVNLVLRLVLDRSGEFQQGEVVVMTGRAVGRFDAWEALPPLLCRISRQLWDEAC